MLPLHSDSSSHAGGVFALKKLICQTDEQVVEARKEIQLLSGIRHGNVLHLIDSAVITNKKGQLEALLLMPLFDTTLQAVIDDGSGYPNSAFNKNHRRFLHILGGFVNGLLAIHKFGYRHCDFKPANVLLRVGSGGDGESVVVTDLGSAGPITIQVSSRSQALVRFCHVILTQALIHCCRQSRRMLQKSALPAIELLSYLTRLHSA